MTKAQMPGKVEILLFGIPRSIHILNGAHYVVIYIW